jgi:hypothetical protein
MSCELHDALEKELFRVVHMQNRALDPGAHRARSMGVKRLLYAPLIEALLYLSSSSNGSNSHPHHLNRLDPDERVFVRVVRQTDEQIPFCKDWR